MKHLEIASSKSVASISSALLPDVELPFPFNTFDGLMLGVSEFSDSGRYLRRNYCISVWVHQKYHGDVV